MQKKVRLKKTKAVPQRSKLSKKWTGTKRIRCLKTTPPTATGQNPPQELLQTLVKHYQDQRYNEAEKLAVFITQNFPKDQSAWKVLGAVLAKGKRLKP